MHQSVLDFGRAALSEREVAGKAILEVGALDVNGSLRAHVEALSPASYVGVDVLRGPGVDLVCDAGHLVEIFGPSRFDLVLCTEMLEHAADWRRVASNLKRVLATLGCLLLTTRSQGFARHHEPDHWRFSLADMEAIFGDLKILDLRPDPGGSGGGPGVFLKALKAAVFWERNLASYEVYSMANEP